MYFTYYSASPFSSPLSTKTPESQPLLPTTTKPSRPPQPPNSSSLSPIPTPNPFSSLPLPLHHVVFITLCLSLSFVLTRFVTTAFSVPAESHLIDVSLFLILISLLRHRPSISKAPTLTLCLSALSLALSFYATLYSLTILPALSVSSLLSLTPFIVALFLSPTRLLLSTLPLPLSAILIHASITSLSGFSSACISAVIAALLYATFVVLVKNNHLGAHVMSGATGVSALALVLIFADSLAFKSAFTIPALLVNVFNAFVIDLFTSSPLVSHLLSVTIHGMAIPATALLSWLILSEIPTIVAITGVVITTMISVFITTSKQFDAVLESTSKVLAKLDAISFQKE